MGYAGDGLKKLLMERMRLSDATFHERARIYFDLAAFQGAGEFALTEDEWVEMQSYVIVNAPISEGQLALPTD